MESLYAPWREAFIKGEKHQGCIFCPDSIVKTDLVLHRRENCFVIMNLYPYSGGHLLVVPNRHTGNLEDLTPNEKQEMFDLLADSVAILKQELKPEGFNIGMNLGKAAGAGVADHLHIHIVPRWTGDTNFMPLLGDVRVVSEDLDSLKQRLLARYAEFMTITDDFENAAYGDKEAK